MDTSCVGTLLLAAANREAGNIVALTGEGADEALAGYVWFKWHRLAVPRLTSTAGRRSSVPRDIALSWLIGGGKRIGRRCSAPAASAPPSNSPGN